MISGSVAFMALVCAVLCFKRSKDAKNSLVKIQLEPEGSGNSEQKQRRHRSNTEVLSEVVHLKKALSEKEENEEGLKREVSFLRERFYSLNDKFVAIKNETTASAPTSDAYSRSMLHHTALNTKEFDRISSTSKITDAPSCVSISVIPTNFAVVGSQGILSSGSEYEDDEEDDLCNSENDNDDDAVITDDGFKLTTVGNKNDDKIDVDRLNHIGYSMEIKPDTASLPLPEMNEASSYDYESPYESLQKKVESLHEEMDEDLESVKHTNAL